MTISLFKTATFAALLTITSALQGQVVRPFTDSACKNPAQVKADFMGSNVAEINLGMGAGNPERGYAYNKYDKINFVNASAPESGSGNWVWWNTGPIDYGCKAVFMVPFSTNAANPVNNWRWMVKDQAPGKVILTASREGCVFTQLPISTTLWTTFCCGNDCDHYSGNAPDGRPAGKKNKREEIASQLQKESAIPATTDMLPRSGSLAARASLQKRTTCAQNDKACADKVWKSCHIDAGNPTLAAGLQVAVSQVQTATAGPKAGDSSIAPTIGFTVGTSTSWSEGTSFSSTQGLSVSMSAGTTFPVKADTTVSASLSFTEEINSSKTTEHNQSKEESVTQSVGMVSGTTGFLSYTPYYNCYMPTISCAGGINEHGAVTVCYPAYDGAGKILGEYGIVTVN